MIEPSCLGLSCGWLVLFSESCLEVFSVDSSRCILQDLRKTSELSVPDLGTRSGSSSTPRSEVANVSIGGRREGLPSDSS